MADELEIAGPEVSDVGKIASQQVVDADDSGTAIEQRLRQVGTDEAGGAGDDHSHVKTPIRQVARCRCGMSARSSVIHMIFRSSDTDQFSM